MHYILAYGKILASMKFSEEAAQTGLVEVRWWAGGHLGQSQVEQQADPEVGSDPRKRSREWVRGCSEWAGPRGVWALCQTPLHTSLDEALGTGPVPRCSPRGPSSW